jgi:hypothetical protein
MSPLEIVSKRPLANMPIVYVNKTVNVDKIMDVERRPMTGVRRTQPDQPVVRSAQVTNRV